MPMVIDASVTMAWCFEDEASPVADDVLDRLRTDEAVVPGLWQLEVANVLLAAGRRRRISHAQAARFLELLGQLPITVDAGPVDPARLVALGSQHGLSAYDACYLLLAERHGLPLATLDASLAAAAPDAGVQVINGA